MQSLKDSPEDTNKEEALTKQYEHKEIESKWLDAWMKKDLYRVQINPAKEKFSIALPPPNVTGELHMGHALSGTVQDVLLRFNRMSGKDVHWQIGTDHAGIGTQIVVEKELKKTQKLRKEDLGREKFIEKVKEWKEEYGNKIIEQMKLMGFSPDYKLCRYTMDDNYAKAVKTAFKKYFDDKLIYRGKRITNWCPHCLTSLSDLEIDKEALSKSLYEIEYKIQGRENEAGIIVATTRPETMFGDTAVAVNPNDERFKSLDAAAMAVIPFTGKAIPIVRDEHVKTDFGTGALKVTPAHDANDFDIGKRHNLDQVLIMDEQANMLNCPEVPESLAINFAGKTLNIPLQGVDRYSARALTVMALTGLDLANEKELEAATEELPKKLFNPDEVVKRLKEKEFSEDSLLKKISNYDQEKDLHDRCGTEIEPYLSDQWYVSMESLAKTALDSTALNEGETGKQTKFVPHRYTSIYRSWLENIQDWCISRQIWWGHRIPVFYYEDLSVTDPEAEKAKDPKSFIKDTKLIRYFASVDHLETELPAKDPDRNIELTNNKQIGKVWQDSDVLDTWFSSALWPFETMKYPHAEVFENFYPTNILATAREIINLWVSRMIFSSHYFENKQEPFADVLIHPVVQTPDGKRMSKSKGNAINPLDLIEQYGADASRMWYASVGIYGQQDVRFPGRKDKKAGWVSDTIEQYRKFANKLHNATKFAMLKIDEDPNFEAKAIEELDLENLALEDKWILSLFASTLTKVEDAYQKYDLNTAVTATYEFLWFSFCDWYIELSKFAQDDEQKATQRQILFYILEASVRILHPVMPFITEELWQVLKSKYFSKAIASSSIDSSLEQDFQDSICFAKFPQLSASYSKKIKAISKENINEKMTAIFDVITAVRNIRQSAGISWSKELEIYFSTEDENNKQNIELGQNFITSITKSKSISKKTNQDLGPCSVAYAGSMQILVPITGIADLDKIKSSLENKISKLDKEILSLSSRLSSENFVKNAPKEKVEEVEQALNTAKTQMGIFKEELAAL